MPSDASAIDHRVVRALAHPTRVRILEVLQQRSLVSPVELSNELKLALGTVGYHVRRLEELGFIELATRTQRRGAVEHHYRARAALDSLGEAPTSGRGRGRGAQAARTAHEAKDAHARGGFDAVAARAEHRVLTLDAPGGVQLSDTLDGWMQTVERIERASDKRRATSGEATATHACTVVVMLFDGVEEPASNGRG